MNIQMNAEILKRVVRAIAVGSQGASLDFNPTAAESQQDEYEIS